MKLTKRDFGLLIAIIYFTFIGGTFYSQLNLLLRVANQVIVTGILGIWLLQKLRNKTGLPRTYLDGAIVLYLLANFLSAALGQSPRFSLETLWFTIVHILAFYLLVDLGRSGWMPKLTWAFYMASAVVCLVSLAEFLAWYFGTSVLANFSQGWWDVGGWRQPIPPLFHRPGAAMNGPTPLSAYLALLVPPAIGLILSLPARDENRKALIIWLVLALVVQILTFSRAGILALGTSLTLTALGWRHIMGTGWPDIRQSWRRLGPVYRLVVAGGSLAVAGMGLFWLQNSFAGRAGSTNFRLVLWDVAVTIFQNQPLAGAGPGNFGRALLRLNDASLPRLQIGTAHSIYFNTAAEMGLIGLIAGTALLATLGWAWQRRWRAAAQPAGQIRLVACGAALAGLAAQTLVDTYTATPNMLVMLALVAYIVVEPPPKAAVRSQLWPAYLAGAVLLIYFAGLLWIARADFYLWRSVRREAQGNWAEAVAQARRSRDLDPALPLRAFRLALLETRLAELRDDPELRTAAIEHYRAGLQQEPILGLNSANLAGLLWQQGERDEAIELLERTVAVEPNALYLVNLGYFYEQVGDWAAAGEAYGQALRGSPGLAASEFWKAAGRTERWPEFVAAAVDQLPANNEPVERLLRVRLALMHEDFDTAEQLAEPAAAITDLWLRNLLAEYYLDQNEPERAGRLLAPAPESGADYLLRGRVELQYGHQAAAEKYFKGAIFLGNRQAYYYLGQLLEQQGDQQAAALAYAQGFPYRAVPEDIPVTIYGRLGGNDLGPHLLRIGLGQRQAQPLLALARLYEQEGRFEDAKRIYELLLAEDPFFSLAREQLARLELEQLP